MISLTKSCNNNNVVVIYPPKRGEVLIVLCFRSSLLVQPGVLGGEEEGGEAVPGAHPGGRGLRHPTKAAAHRGRTQPGAAGAGCKPQTE